MKLTPVLIVEEIEKSLPFWVDRMGFAKTVEVPEGPRLGFVILVREGAELMMQTLESVRKDVPAFAPEGPLPRGCGMFIEVDDFEDVRKRLAGYPIAMAERVSFYGMRDIGVSEPSGPPGMFAAKRKGKAGLRRFVLDLRLRLKKTHQREDHKGAPGRA